MADHNERQMTNAQIYRFFEQFGALYSSGITARETLEIMQKDEGTGELSGLTAYLAEGMDLKYPFSVCVEQTGVFPDYVPELLKLGEETGKLDEVCGSLSRYYKEQDDLMSSVRSAVTYPVVMILVMFAVTAVLVLRVLPLFDRVFSQLGASMSGFAEGLLRFSRLLSRSYAALSLCFAALVLLFLYFFVTDSGRKHFRKFLSVFPPTRSLSDCLAMAKFSSALRMTQAAGLEPDRCLELSLDVADDKKVKERGEESLRLLREGESFSDAVSLTGLFPPFYAGMLRVFARAGHMDRAMDFISEHYREETDRRIGGILSAIEPTLVAILSLVVGAVIVSVMLPLMGLMTNLG